MTAGHMPGPWTVTHTNGSYWVESQDTVICLVQGANLTPEQNSELAYLIAAAPELLAELKFAASLSDIWQCSSAQVQRMDEVIAKATGKTP